jgi:hypothetical protein
MKVKDQLKFRELQVIFFMGMTEYPDDKERMEKMFGILEKFIDDLITRECSAIVAQSSALRVSHGNKGN